MQAIFLPGRANLTNLGTVQHEVEANLSNAVGTQPDPANSSPNPADPLRLWVQISQTWLQKRSGTVSKVKHLADDAIRALLSVKESRFADSEREMAALTMCCKDVAPLYSNVFSGEDLVYLAPSLANLVPNLPPSEFVPSTLFLDESAGQRELSAVALLQITSLDGGQPSQNMAIVQACIVTTRWLFQKPRTFNPVTVPSKQPLNLISNHSTSCLISEYFSSS